ncbi:MAG: hypothetical protein IKY74_06840 [Alistipes sp.]|nr:hypothetical protein [Alistipes sp.]
MVTLFIDGIDCPLVEGRVAFPLFNAKKLRSIEDWRSGESVVLEVEATPQMDWLFGFANEANHIEEFNTSYHLGEVRVDGVLLIAGVASLVGARVGKSRSYRVEVRTGGAEWADNVSTTRLSATDIDTERIMTLTSVKQSWRDDGDVRLLPIKRDTYVKEAHTGQYVPQQTILPQDYHPFLSLRAIVEKSICRDGYTIQSNFLDTEFFKSLMLSGAYSQPEIEQAYSTMDFKAVRSKSTTTTSSLSGRVDVSAPEGGWRLGPLVDTISPSTLDENGDECYEAFSRGGCFKIVSGIPTFRPSREVRVAFDLRLHYTTDYRIISSTRLEGYDKIYISSDCYVDVDLINPYKDRRATAQPGIQYTLFIFDYNPEASYRLSSYGTVVSAVSSIVLPKSYTGRLTLSVMLPGQTMYAPYDGDWALYDGIISETGRREVDITLRTPFEVLTPSSPKEFQTIYFYGASAEQNLTLHSGCSIVPIFGGTAGYGELLSFKDVAHHDISQALAIEAVAHLFNLCIYTHIPTKRVYIEPYDDFFNGEVVDWRERQRREDEVISEGASEGYMAETLGYQQSDGATARLTSGSEPPFGRWNIAYRNYAVKGSVRSRLNPILLATASMDNATTLAPSAKFLVVGDRDRIANQEYIAPRIVSYQGVKQLPNGEMWPLSSGINYYPLVTFHDPDSGVSLCFEDRDGCSGLHRYYDRELQETYLGQTLTTNIALAPEQYMKLFDPMSEEANIRSRFLLNIGSSSALFRLDEIVSYDAEKKVARCRFQRVLSGQTE